MSKLSEAKTLGGVGAILVLIGGFIPIVGAVIPIIGVILILLAVKKIAEESKNDSIFKNYLFYFILNVISTVVVISIIFISVGGLSFISTLQSSDFSNPDVISEVFGSLIVGCILAGVIGWIMLIVGTLYLRRSYNSIAECTGVDKFKTAGTLYFVGALTLIVFFIGAFIILIGAIFEIIAYFSLPDEMPLPGSKDGAARRCPNCGRTIPEDANTCPYCGKMFVE